MKGVILAGGTGSRLYPMNTILTKQLQPIYNKPMIYYPLSTLMLAGIKDILLIVTERDCDSFCRLLGDGKHLGLSVEYAIQHQPRGLAEAFILGESFIKGQDVCLILGDNFFYGNFNAIYNAARRQKERENEKCAHILAYRVMNPSDYGIVEFDRKDMRVVSIEEKPKCPKSPYAAVGMYFFDSTVSSRAKRVSPSKRGELEITSVLESYLEDDALGVELIGRGTTWFDMGTPDSFQSTGNFVQMIERKHQYKIACIEEIALRMGYITKDKFFLLIERAPNCGYKDYLLKIYDEFTT